MLGSRAAFATLSAIACLIVVHRIILAGCMAVRLVHRKTYRANQGCQNRKQKLRIIFHKLRWVATKTKANENHVAVQFEFRRRFIAVLD
jgi:hypothetical protein